MARNQKDCPAYLRRHPRRQKPPKTLAEYLATSKKPPFQYTRQILWDMLRASQIPAQTVDPPA